MIVILVNFLYFVNFYFFFLNFSYRADWLTVFKKFQIWQCFRDTCGYPHHRKCVV